MRLHSRVRALRQVAGTEVGSVGAVVGFTPECVEVKFGRRIVKCSVYDVAICEELGTQRDENVGASFEFLGSRREKTATGNSEENASPCIVKPNVSKRVQKHLIATGLSTSLSG